MVKLIIHGLKYSKRVRALDKEFTFSPNLGCNVMDSEDAKKYVDALLTYPGVELSSGSPVAPKPAEEPKPQPQPPKQSPSGPQPAEVKVEEKPQPKEEVKEEIKGLEVPKKESSEEVKLNN